MTGAAPDARPPARERVRFPTRVRLRWSAGAARRWRSARDGDRRAAGAGDRARRSGSRSSTPRFPAGTDDRERQRRAVGIGELRGTGLPAARRRGPIQRGLRLDRGDRRRRPPAAAACGRRARSPTSTPAARCASLRCGPPVALPAGRGAWSATPGLFAPYLLRLRVARAASAPAAPIGGGRVLDPGDVGPRRARPRPRSTLTSPAWLVLGESYNRGWRADVRRAIARRPAASIDGFANGMAGARRAAARRSSAFAPEPAGRTGATRSRRSRCLLLLGLILLRRPGRRAGRRAGAAAGAPDDPARWPLRPGARRRARGRAGARLRVRRPRAAPVIAPAVAFVLLARHRRAAAAGGGRRAARRRRADPRRSLIRRRGPRRLQLRVRESTRSPRTGWRRGGVAAAARAGTHAQYGQGASRRARAPAPAAAAAPARAP